MLNRNWIANFEKELRNDKLSVDFYPLFPVPETTIPKKLVMRAPLISFILPLYSNTFPYFEAPSISKESWMPNCTFCTAVLHYVIPFFISAIYISVSLYLTRRRPHWTNVNHCPFSLFNSKITGISECSKGIRTGNLPIRNLHYLIATHYFTQMFHFYNPSKPLNFWHFQRV